MFIFNVHNKFLYLSLFKLTNTCTSSVFFVSLFSQYGSKSITRSLWDLRVVLSVGEVAGGAPVLRVVGAVRVLLGIRPTPQSGVCAHIEGPTRSFARHYERLCWQIHHFHPPLLPAFTERSYKDVGSKESVALIIGLVCKCNAENEI